MKTLLSPLSEKARMFLGRVNAVPAATRPRVAPGQTHVSGPKTARFSAKTLEALGLPLIYQPAELALSVALIDQGCHFVRQDRLDALGRAIASKDRAREMTPAGTPMAELLAAGARSDLSRAMYSASDAGALSSGSRVFAGIEMLSDAVCDHPEDPICAAVLALTYMDAGWAWYRQGWQRGRPETHLGAFQNAFGRARALLDPICALEQDSPLVASARCALLAGQPDAETRVVDDYEDLIDLAPAMPGHMRAFGLHLLPCWFGSYAKLELQARRMAARSQDIWGNGAYVWVYLDAALQDGACFAFLDIELFSQGVEDILARSSDQHLANVLAAYLSRMIGPAQGDGPDRAQRKALTYLRDRILRSHMTEVHPWVWALMDTGYSTPGSRLPEGEDDIALGTQQAWDAVQSVFARELTQLG